MSLLGKKVLVVGGNGYVGNYFASRFVQQAATVSCLSRKGIKYDFPENSRIDWLVGDILQPTKFVEQINSADIIVHTVGTLLDTSVTKGTAIGGPGTYQQINRDTFASLLNTLKQPKKIVYLSSASHPPFLQRYLTTKYEAENLLFNSQHEGYSMRPGFITSWQHRKWSIPIKFGIDVWSKVYPFVQKITPPQTFLQKILKQSKQENTSLQEMGDALLELCLNGSQTKIIQNAIISQLSQKYKNSQRV